MLQPTALRLLLVPVLLVPALLGAACMAPTKAAFSEKGADLFGDLDRLTHSIDELNNSQQSVLWKAHRRLTTLVVGEANGPLPTNVQDLATSIEAIDAFWQERVEAQLADVMSSWRIVRGAKSAKIQELTKASPQIGEQEASKLAAQEELFAALAASVEPLGARIESIEKELTAAQIIAELNMSVDDHRELLGRPAGVIEGAIRGAFGEKGEATEVRARARALGSAFQNYVVPGAAPPAQGR